MTVDQLVCSVHPDQPAEGRCGRCGRPTCLTCAVPVRGDILCREDALDETGRAAPPVPPAPTDGTRERVALALLIVALVATAIPWHRFGILTSILSAWTPEAGWWPPIACAAVAIGVVAGVWRSRTGSRRALRLAAIAPAGAAACAGLAVVTAPAFVSHGPAPFMLSAAAAAASALSFLRLRRA